MHTIIVKNNHDVLVFGANGFGQFGLGLDHNQNKPIILMHNTSIRQSHVVTIIRYF